MTIPTLISKYQEQTTITKVKKAYSTISQAATLAKIEYGEPSTWFNFNDSYDVQNQDITNILIKYLKGATDFGSSFYNLKISSLNSSVYSLDGTYYETLKYNKRQIVELFDGIFIIISGGQTTSSSSKIIAISIITNGFSQKPLVWGKNYFYFELDDKKFTTIDATGRNYGYAGKLCDISYSKYDNGIECSKYILEGNMNYLHK